MTNPTLDIVTLIEKNPLTKFSENYQSRFVEKLKGSFSDSDQQLFLASFYTYLNYNMDTDFVIDLDNIWKWLGYTRKDHCKVVLEKHFKKDIDYKINQEENFAPEVAGANSDFPPATSGAKTRGGSNKEQILMTVKAFKKLCLKSNTNRADSIHDYFIKLEEILHETVSEESEDLKKKFLVQNKQLQEKEKLLEEKEKLIENYETTPDTEGFSRKSGELYLIIEISKLIVGYYIKFGIAANSIVRVDQLNVGSSTSSLKLYAKFETFDRIMTEKLVHQALQPFRIKNRNEWFFFKNDHELAYAIDSVKKILNFINQFDIKNYKEFKELTKDLNPEDHLIPVEESEDLHKENNDRIIEQTKRKNREILQKAPARTGTFKGVSWDSNNQLWCAQIQNNYKHEFLGYYSDEIDAAKIYNDFALYLNETEGTSFVLNDIPGYRTVPRNIPEIMRREKEEKKSSKWRGVSYDSKRKHFVAGIQLTGKTYNLGNDLDEDLCGHWYNCQALYFNNTLGTTYPLNEIPGYTPVSRNIHAELTETAKKKKTSKYVGVSKTAHGKWACNYMMNRKKIHIATCETELEAVQRYNETVTELNKQGFNYKVNNIE